MNEVARDMSAVGEISVRGDAVMDGYYKDSRALLCVRMRTFRPPTC